MTGSFTPVMDKALTHFHQHGKLPEKINGRKTSIGTVDGLVWRGALEQTQSGYELTDSGRARAKSLIGENVDNHRPNRYVMHWWDNAWRATFDIGQTDYEYWDKARRCEIEGLELAGLFLKALASKKAAWVLGAAPQIKCGDEYTQTRLNEWMRRYHTDVLLAYEEAVNLGDEYLVVNPDESVTPVAPHVVRPLVSEDDWSQILGYRITQTYSHPEKLGTYQTVDDVYTSRGRERIIKQAGQQTNRDRYRVTLPKAPVVQIANNLRANERHGHAEGEALLKALMIYGEMLSSSSEGVVKQGRPMPVFSKMGDNAAVDKFIEMYGEEKSRTLPNGTVEYWTEVQLNGGDVVVLGGTGELQQVQPDQFTNDAVAMLKIIFYLMIQHTEMPEFLWGNAISGNQASADKTQMPTFAKWAEKEQGRAEKWLLPLFEIVLSMMALVDNRIDTDADITLKWMPLTTSDDKLTLEAIKIALTVGGWSPEDLVPYYPLDIDDPQVIINKIIAMREEERARMNGEDEPFVAAPADSQDDESPTDDPEADDADVETETFNKQLLEAAHTGAMVAFEIPLDVATSLALAARQSGIEAVVAPEDMHITLAYLDEVAAIEDKREAIEGQLTNFADGISMPLVGSVAGIGRFNAGENTGGKDVIYASFDSPELPAFRQALVEAIESTGVEISRAHGFTPHITLAYVDTDTTMPNLALETMALKFDEIVLAWGDERSVFRLNIPEQEEIKEMV